MEHEAATITAGTLTGDDYQITAAGQLDEDANCITFTVKLVRLSASDNGSSADESYKVCRRGCQVLRNLVQSHISRVRQNHYACVLHSCSVDLTRSYTYTYTCTRSYTSHCFCLLLTGSYFSI